MKISKYITIILSTISFLLLSNFLWWHWRLGLTRYFDADEFAHLHWAYQIFTGQKPYIDFSFFIPPGYQWFLAPVFFLGKGVTPFFAGRVGAFVVFAALVLATICLFWLTRKNWLAPFAGVLLAFLPLPYDKFLEIRPDNLAALLLAVGVIWQIRWLREKNKAVGFLAGFFYALSLLVLPKSLPAVTVAMVVGLMSVYKTIKNYLVILIGFMLPILLFARWILAIGNWELVLYSIFRLPFEVNKLSQVFYMSPDLFFYPNQIYYGIGGWSQTLIVNHVIWVFGLVVGIGRLFTPFLAGEIKGVRRIWEEVLISGIFIVQVVYYVLWSPLKHAQYLIPIGVFVAFFAADGISLVWSKTRGQWGRETAFSICFCLAAILLYGNNIQAQSPKLTMTTADTLALLQKLYNAIPAKEYVLDLDGATLYYRSPYYACCLPFGQYARFLSRPLPSLPEALEKTQTKYIWESGLGRVKTMTPEAQNYIKEHYTQMDIPGLLVRN